jgi:hypothetical protein
MPPRPERRILGHPPAGALMRLRFALVLSIGLIASACIDQSRVNDTCTWSDPVSGRLDPSRSADRNHLRIDAEIVNELTVRWGDAHGPHRPDLQRPYRDECMQALIDTVTARHGVTAAAFHAAERDRPWWFDVVVVFLPMALLAAFVMDWVVRRVCGSFDSDDRRIATVSVVGLTLVVALLTLGVANFWAFGVEGSRLHNGHVSNRAFLIPIVTHGWIAWWTSLAVCTAAASARFWRTPLTGDSRRQFRDPGSSRTARSAR